MKEEMADSNLLFSWWLYSATLDKWGINSMKLQVSTTTCSWKRAPPLLKPELVVGLPKASAAEVQSQVH